MRSLSATVKSSPYSRQLEKIPDSNQDPAQPEINKQMHYLKKKKKDTSNVLGLSGQNETPALRENSGLGVCISECNAYIFIGQRQFFLWTLSD